MKKKRTVELSYVTNGEEGPIYKVVFLEDGVAKGTWPANGSQLSTLVEAWIMLGKRPQ